MWLAPPRALSGSDRDVAAFASAGRQRNGQDPSIELDSAMTMLGRVEREAVIDLAQYTLSWQVLEGAHGRALRSSHRRLPLW